MSRTPLSADFAIVGGGAMGSILAARLIAAGADVVILARGTRAHQIERSGLIVEGIESHRSACDVLTDPARLQNAKFLIFAVKTYDHAAAVHSLQHVQAEFVFSMANGIAKTGELAQCFGKDSSLGCVAEFSGELLEDGHVRYTRNTGITLGSPFKPAGDTECRAIEALHALDLDVTAALDITSVEWSKFVAWAPLMSIAVLTRLATGRLLAECKIARITIAVIRELATLAGRLGIMLRDQPPLPVATLAQEPFDVAKDTLMALGRKLQASAPDHHASSLQDHLRGKPLEVEESLGHARRLAAAEDIDTPVLDVCYSLVSGMNASALREK